MTQKTIRDLIRTKFNTDAAFALAMGWMPQKVTKMVYGKYKPKLAEAVKMSQVLDTSLTELASFFEQ